MKLNIYLAFVKDGKGKPRAGVLLAEDRKQALARAVARCKQAFGRKSRVSLITHVAEADLSMMTRTQAYKMLSQFDQVIFASVELEKLTAKSMQLITQMQKYVKHLQDKVQTQNEKENHND